MKKRLSPYKWRKRKKEVFERDKGQCQICFSRFMLDVHHKIRRSKGGSDEMENLVLLCRVCHNAQHPEKQVRWTRKQEAVEAFNKIYPPDDLVPLLEESVRRTKKS